MAPVNDASFIAGYEDERDPSGGELVGNDLATLAAHIEIQDGSVDVMSFKCLKGSGGVARGSNHMMTDIAENVLEHRRDEELILDDEKASLRFRARVDVHELPPSTPLVEAAR